MDSMHVWSLGCTRYRLQPPTISIAELWVCADVCSCHRFVALSTTCATQPEARFMHRGGQCVPYLWFYPLVMVAYKIFINGLKTFV